MRRSPCRVAVVVLLGLATLAPDARADRTVEDWVGIWTGKASWKGCTAPGGAALTVAVSWHDGALWIDGSALYEGLGEVTTETRPGGAVVHEVDGLEIELRTATKKSKGKATITLSTAAQCTMTAKVARPSSGIGACDDLVALAGAASGCGLDLDDDPATEVDGWRALTGKKRRKAATACQARVDTLRVTLVAEQCLPPQNDPSDVAECRDTWRLAQRMVQCQRLPAEDKAGTLQGIAELKRSLRSLHDRADAADIATTACKDTNETLKVIVDALGC